MYRIFTLDYTHQRSGSEAPIGQRAVPPNPRVSIGTPNWWHQRSMQPHWAYSCYACRTECSCRWHPKQLQSELTKRITQQKGGQAKQTKQNKTKQNKTKQTNKQTNKTKQNKTKQNKQTKQNKKTVAIKNTPPNTLINWIFLLAKSRMLKEKEETKCRNTIVIACMFCHFCVLSNCLGFKTSIKFRIFEKNLVGGWTNPFEKYARQNGNLPQIGA